MNSLLQRALIYAIMILIYSVYCVLHFVPITSIKTINAIGIASLVILALLTWLLVRPRLLRLWSEYLVLSATYLGAIYPDYSYAEEIIVYTLALTCLSVMAHDIIIDNCNGIPRRTFLRINSERMVTIRFSENWQQKECPEVPNSSGAFSL